MEFLARRISSKEASSATPSNFNALSTDISDGAESSALDPAEAATPAHRRRHQSGEQPALPDHGRAVRRRRYWIAAAAGTKATVAVAAAAAMSGFLPGACPRGRRKKSCDQLWGSTELRSTVDYYYTWKFWCHRRSDGNR